MTHDEAVKAVVTAPDALTAARIAFKAIDEFSDTEMLDGDAARVVATAWMAQWASDLIKPD